uniref:Uncharacterized protein n=1 Tax=Oryza punctata TaxID=4537 RepID=A0A0E0JWF1_ORYPU
MEVEHLTVAMARITRLRCLRRRARSAVACRERRPGNVSFVVQRYYSLPWELKHGDAASTLEHCER